MVDSDLCADRAWWRCHLKRLSEIVWGSPRRAMVTTAVVVGAMTILFVAVPTLRDLTAWAVPAGAVAFLIRQYPAEAKRTFGRALEYLAWTSQAVERESVRQSVEGSITVGARQFSKSCEAAAAPKVRLEFVRSGEEIGELPDGTIVLAIAHHRERAANLAAAAWAYAKFGILRSARRHIDPDLAKGIDFVVTKEILSGVDPRAFRSFVEEIWRPAITDAGRLRLLTEKLEVLQEDELLGPVLLNELHELGIRQVNRLPNDGIAEESAAFVDLLFDISQREHGQDGPTEFEGQSIRCKFVFVARAEVYAVKGPDPYRRAVEWSIVHGYRNIYLLARGRHAGYAVEVASFFRDDPRVFEPVVWTSTIARGARQVVRAVVRVPVDVRYVVGIGQRPLIAVGPGAPRAVTRKSQGA